MTFIYTSHLCSLVPSDGLTGFRLFGLFVLLLEPQSRFGDKPLKLQVVCPQSGTAVLKGLSLLFGLASGMIYIYGLVLVRKQLGVLFLLGSFHIPSATLCAMTYAVNRMQPISGETCTASRRVREAFDIFLS